MESPGQPELQHLRGPILPRDDGTVRLLEHAFQAGAVGVNGAVGGLLLPSVVPHRPPRAPAPAESRVSPPCGAPCRSTASNALVVAPVSRTVHSTGGEMFRRDDHPDAQPDNTHLPAPRKAAVPGSAGKKDSITSSAMVMSSGVPKRVSFMLLGARALVLGPQCHYHTPRAASGRLPPT